MIKLKLLLVIILGFFLSINCADDDKQPGKKIKISFDMYECEVCGKDSECQLALIMNARDHIKQEPFESNYSNYKDENSEATFQMPNLNSTVKRFVCDYMKKNGEICGKYFTNKSNLNRHKRELHKKLKRFVCDYKDNSGNICGKTFSRKLDLVKHKMTHINTKQFICDYEDKNSIICCKSYFRKTDLTRHKKVHTKEKQ